MEPESLQPRPLRRFRVVRCVRLVPTFCNVAYPPPVPLRGHDYRVCRRGSRGDGFHVDQIAWIMVKVCVTSLHVVAEATKIVQVTAVSIAFLRHVNRSVSDAERRCQLNIKRSDRDRAGRFHVDVGFGG